MYTLLHLQISKLLNIQAAQMDKLLTFDSLLQAEPAGFQGQFKLQQVWETNELIDRFPISFQMRNDSLNQDGTFFPLLMARGYFKVHL